MPSFGTTDALFSRIPANGTFFFHREIIYPFLL